MRKESKKHRPKKKFLFTLIELLIIVVIIMILICLILPALRTAKRTANRIVCASNMRQVGLATISYGNDNNGCIPGFSWVGGIAIVSTLTNQIGSSNNSGAIYPVAGTQLLFKALKYQTTYLWCNDLTHQDALEQGNTSVPTPGTIKPYYSPSTSTESHLSCPTFGLASGVVIYRSSYEMNGPGATEKRCTHLQRLHIQKPYHLLLGERYSSPYRGPGYSLTVYEKAPYCVSQVAFRHIGPSANFIFFDMHVENWKSAMWSANRVNATDVNVASSGRHSWPL